jgi:hypothetical protein
MARLETWEEMPEKGNLLEQDKNGGIVRKYIYSTVLKFFLFSAIA